MKRFTTGSLLLALLALTTVLVASEAKKYGKELTLKETTPVADILAAPEKFKGQRVLVEGTVIDVCAKMGCWIKIQAGEGIEPITFKVDDGVITFPIEAKGKRARAEGVVDVRTVTEDERIAQVKHEAEENNRLDSFDPSAIKGSKTVVRIMGEGAVIGD